MPNEHPAGAWEKGVCKWDSFFFFLAYTVASQRFLGVRLGFLLHRGRNAWRTPKNICVIGYIYIGLSMGEGRWAYNEGSHYVFRDTGFALLESWDLGF